MEPLQVALVRARYTPYGGAERFVQRALEALARDGLAVTVLAREWVGAGESDAPGVRWQRIDPFHLGRIWRDLSFRRGVRRALAQGRFDLVQSHERIPGLPVYRAGDGVHRVFLQQRARVLGPLARLRLKIDPQHLLALATERAMFRHPALRAVICNSRMVQHEIHTLFDVPLDKLPLVRNGVDTTRYAPPDAGARQAARAALDLPAGAPVFLFLGSGFERKGLAPTLDAFARLRATHPHARLLVVGTDRHAARYRARARALGVDGAVRFAGGQREVRPWLHAADVLVLPSLYDPFPNAALEALACGLPVVASDRTGVAELLDEASGRVTDPLDVPAIARAMGELLEAPERRRAAARALAETCSLEHLSAALGALYTRLLADAGARRSA